MTKLRVAVCGGGLGGASMINALLPNPNIDVSIFESAPAFSEAGAAVGIAANGRRALEMIGLPNALSQAGAVDMHSSRAMLAQGPSAGAHVADNRNEPGDTSAVVHRARLLSSLLTDVPPAKMHVNKKVVSISETPGNSDRPQELTLHFSDKTNQPVDILIGADGLHSAVRTHILGANSPAGTPSYAGWVHTFCLFPIDEVKKMLDPETYPFLYEARQYAWIGDGACFIHDHLDDGGMLQCIAIIHQKHWDGGKWRDKKSGEEMGSYFDGWTHEVKNVIQTLLGTKDEVEIYPQYHIPKPIFSVPGKHAALIGDAAHASTPWSGSGAGFAVEDSLVLSELLSNLKFGGGAKSMDEQITAALQAYSRARMERAVKLIDMSNETGMLLTGQYEGIGLDRDGLAEKEEGKWPWIYAVDLKAHVEGAKTTMNDLLK